MASSNSFWTRGHAAFKSLLDPKPFPPNANQDLKVIIVGAGMSGISSAAYLQKRGFTNFVILEKDSQAGGTWFQQNYPGVACDIPSHFYSFSFHPWNRWTRNWPKKAELYEYISEVIEKFNVNKFAKFHTTVTHADWDSRKKVWAVYTKNSQTGKEEVFTGNVLLNGTGILNVPLTPKISGQEQFQGCAIHTGDWPADPNIMEPEITNRDVAIIGTGASCIQALPVIARTAKKVTVYQRTPAWSPNRFDFFYPKFLMALFKMFPFLLRLYRWVMYFWIEIAYLQIIVDNHFLRWITHKSLEVMHWFAVKDNATMKKLMPDYKPGCKRIAPSDEYLKAYNRDNVHLITDGIAKLEKNGIVTKTGEKQKHDTIVYATGYSLIGAMNWFKITGTDKTTEYKEVMGDTPQAFFGMTNAGFPNHFRLLGPNTTLAHNSVLFMIECQLHYVMDALDQLAQDSSKKVMELKPGVLERHYEYIYGSMENRTFFGNCLGWYRNAKGINWPLWPNSTLSYWWNTCYCQSSDYNFY